MYAYKPQLIDLQILKKLLILNIFIVLYKAYVPLYIKIISIKSRDPCLSDR